MRKFFTLIILSLVFYLVGCDLEGSTINTTNTTQVETTSVSTSTSTDIITSTSQNLNFVFTLLDYDDTILFQETYEYNFYLSNLSIIEPIREGYTFIGWSSDIPEQMPSRDFTANAEYSINEYTIDFNSNGGNNIYSITKEYDSNLNEPINPTKDGYTFDGWYSDIELTQVYVFDKMPSEDITLYAKWVKNQYIINYYIYDNYISDNHISLEDNEFISSIEMGNNHSSLLTTEGRLFMWGDNDYGSVGDGTDVDRSFPVDITGNFNLAEGEKILSVSLGNSSSAAITSTGRVFTWGRNNKGQLGNGEADWDAMSFVPVDITGQFNLNNEEKIVMISLGSYNSSALSSSGRVFTWGYNSSGELGDGTKINKLVPTDITSRFNLNNEEKIVIISMKYWHMGAITSEGRLFMWGNNERGQLGNDSISDRNTPVDITSHFLLNPEEKILSLSVGLNHSAALTTEGRMFTWGSNSYNQLGDGDNLSYSSEPIDITSYFNLDNQDMIISISLGGDHSAAITENGLIFTWGYNLTGQIGNDTNYSSDLPLNITNNLVLVNGERIVQVSLGQSNSSALTSNGHLFTWGYNGSGQLGNGTKYNKYLPQEVEFMVTALEYTEKVYYNDNIIEYTPTREGYILDGWYTDRQLTQKYNFSNMPSENIELFAKWVLID